MKELSSNSISVRGLYQSLGSGSSRQMMLSRSSSGMNLVIDLRPVNGDVTIEVALLNKVLQCRQNSRLPNEKEWTEARIIRRSSS